jgi:hypothetical protein
MNKQFARLHVVTEQPHYRLPLPYGNSDDGSARRTKQSEYSGNGGYNYSTRQNQCYKQHDQGHYHPSATPVESHLGNRA